MGSSIDREKVIKELSELHGSKETMEIIEQAIALLKEQDDQIEQLEHDLAVTQNNLNYYVNGND